MFDAVVVGGGSAGLSAALILGRARRNVLVLDTGAPRNAPAAAAHGVFTRDGTPPAELLRIAREQLAPYTTVVIRNDLAVAASVAASGFDVVTASGERVRARRLLLACGVVDRLPAIEGIERLWGESVVHCPYCHGWEVRDEPLAYIADGPAATEFGALLLGWSRDLVLCTNGSADLTAEQRAQLGRHGIAIREQPIARLEGEDRQLRAVVFDDGSVLERRALFVRPPQSASSDIAVMLQCAHTPEGFVAIDDLGSTSVAGVFAAGDITTPAQQVIRAAASGAVAAAGLNRSLAVEDFAMQPTTQPESERRYVPLDCALHDRLESAAVLRRSVSLRYVAVTGDRVEETVRIRDILTERGAEYLVLDSGNRVRLDCILSMDGLPFSDPGDALRAG